MLREALKISSPLPLVWGKCQDFTAGHSGTLHRATAEQLPADEKSMAEEKGACHGFLEGTSLKGVSRIVKSDGISLKILWIVAVVFGLSVTIYQVG